jgi:transcriptional regulator GlxA family with amidase domain
LVGAQCSGTLLLAKLGLLQGIPACTDDVTKPWVQEAGIDVLPQPFFAQGNVATAGGCLSSQYLACWVVARLLNVEIAKQMLECVAPVGEKAATVERMLKNVVPYLS